MESGRYQRRNGRVGESKYRTEHSEGVATLEVVGGSNTHFSNGHQVSVLTPPVAHIRDGTFAYLNTAVTFDGSGSHDPDDGTGPGLGISTWSWSFTGGVPASVTTTTSSANTTYSTIGEKEVTLTVTDNEGDSNSTTRTISVIPATPVADAGENQTVYIGTAVNFDGSGSRKPGGGDLTYLWNFGDDASPTTTGSGVNPSHTYSTPDVKTVTLTVTDNQGNTDSDTCTVTVIELTAVLEPVDNFSGRSNNRYGLAEVINLSFIIEPTGIIAAEIGGL